MALRSPAVGAVCAVLVAASTAGAANAAGAGRSLEVRPGSPVVGLRVTIVVRGAPTVKRLAVEIVTPTGIPLRLRLARAGAGMWRARYRFTDDGTWTLSVRLRGTVSSRRIFVKQPPAPIPPFKPWQLATGPKANLGTALTGGGIPLPLPWP